MPPPAASAGAASAPSLSLLTPSAPRLHLQEEEFVCPSKRRAPVLVYEIEMAPLRRRYPVSHARGVRAFAAPAPHRASSPPSSPRASVRLNPGAGPEAVLVRPPPPPGPEKCITPTTPRPSVVLPVVAGPDAPTTPVDACGVGPAIAVPTTPMSPRPSLPAPSCAGPDAPGDRVRDGPGPEVPVMRQKVRWHGRECDGGSLRCCALPEGA
jgi:hypothetical protein